MTIDREAIARIVREHLQEGMTWRDDDGLVQGEYSLADALISRTEATGAAGGGELREALERTREWICDQAHKDEAPEHWDIVRSIDKALSAKPAVGEPPAPVAAPYSYCCAEAGGHVDACDCVNKNHGTARFDAPAGDREAVAPVAAHGGEHLDWLRIARAAGEHGVRYRTNRTLRAFFRDIGATLAPSAPSAPAGGYGTGWQGDVNELRVRIQRALQATLGDTVDCTRVWSAWGYGTMGEDDFVPVLERMDEIIDEISEQIRTPTLTPSATSAPDELMTAAEIEAWEAAPSGEGLREALKLARNRLQSHAVDSIARGDKHSIEHREWADQATDALSASPAPKIATSAELIALGEKFKDSVNDKGGGRGA